VLSVEKYSSKKEVANQGRVQILMFILSKGESERERKIERERER
jgi:hypothetical protein